MNAQVKTASTTNHVDLSYLYQTDYDGQNQCQAAKLTSFSSMPKIILLREMDKCGTTGRADFSNTFS